MNNDPTVCMIPQGTVSRILVLTEQIQRPQVTYRTPDVDRYGALDMAHEALEICQQAAQEIDDLLEAWSRD